MPFAGIDRNIKTESQPNFQNFSMKSLGLFLQLGKVNWITQTSGTDTINVHDPLLHAI